MVPCELALGTELNFTIDPQTIQTIVPIMDIKALKEETWTSISQELNRVADTLDRWKFLKFQDDGTERSYSRYENIDWDDEVASSAIFDDIEFASEMQYIEYYGLSDVIEEDAEITIKSNNIDFAQLSDGISKCHLAASHLDARLLEESLNTVAEINSRLKLSLEEPIDNLFELMSTLTVSSGELIYVPQNTEIIIPQLIIPIKQDLINSIQNNPSILYSISPRDFEELIAELFARRGFEVQLTKKTRDGGLDIIAVHEIMGVLSKYIIECKRYKKQRRVSLELVQRLMGVKVSTSANKAIMVTTSSYTKDAIAFANNHIWDLDLKDYNDIMTWIAPSSSNPKDV